MSVAYKISDTICSVEDTLESCNLTQHAEKLKTANNMAIQALTGNAGWHNTQDIQTLIGLGGEYLWAENAVANKIRFSFNPNTVGSAGTYTIQNLLNQTIEQGAFNCVPNNPAIGWAFIGLLPTSGNIPRNFIVNGMFTEANWKIIILLLNKLDAQGPVYPAFSCIRMAD